MIESALRRSLEGEGDDRVLTLGAAFSGLPETAHGGSVLGIFDLIAGRSGRRVVAGLYRRRVPLDVPLRLRLSRSDPHLTCRLSDASGSVLVEGEVSSAGPTTASPSSTADPLDGGDPLPISSRCFACGVDNPLGLRAKLRFDEKIVGGPWTPSESFRSRDGSLALVAITTLLDEAAFWLGALASGESGMTTDLRVAVHGEAPSGGAISIAGSRASVRQRPDDARYWDTEVIARDHAGAPVATGRITFVAVRGAARKLVTGMLAMNPPEVLRRVFPEYAR